MDSSRKFLIYIEGVLLKRGSRECYSISFLLERSFTVSRFSWNVLLQYLVSPETFFCVEFVGRRKRTQQSCEVLWRNGAARYCRYSFLLERSFTVSRFSWNGLMCGVCGEKKKNATELRGTMTQQSCEVL